MSLSQEIGYQRPRFSPDSQRVIFSLQRGGNSNLFVMDLRSKSTMRLTDTQDASLSRMAMIQPDGSFAVQWVPAGTYTLAVSNASNMPRQPGRRGQQGETGTNYAPFQESLTVTDTDVSGVGVTLTPAATNQ